MIKAASRLYGARLIALLGTCHALLACGAPPPEIECETAGRTCEQLGSRRGEVEQQYEDAVVDDDAAMLTSLGSCNVELLRAQLSAEDQCGLSKCAELCALNPCYDTGDEDGCVSRCETESASLSEGAFDTLLESAARTPNQCNCQICPEASAAFCERVWPCEWSH